MRNLASIWARGGKRKEPEAMAISAAVSQCSAFAVTSSPVRTSALRASRRWTPHRVSPLLPRSLILGTPIFVQCREVVSNWRILPQGTLRSSGASPEEKDGGKVAESQQQWLRNSVLRIGMVLSCPLLATTTSTVLDDYSSGSAVALEVDHVAAIPVSVSAHWSSSFTFELLHRVGVPLADLDPATAKLAITVLGPFFAFFNLLFIFRIVMSWYPQIPVGKFPFVLAYAPTEPILGPTRRLIPPVGGVDVAPVIWVALVSFLNEVLLGKQGLFILLSQQQS